MKNDYYYWNNYLYDTTKKIEKLIEKKEIIYTDFHIHSDYSADGTQTLKDIITRSKKIGLDIISITDHDSISVYDELYDYLKTNDISTPIIVPGIEFTVENKEYGSQCHILQLMINPKEKSIMENVEYNKKAMWNRVKLQFKRISENNTLQYFFNKFNIECSEEKYREFLNNNYKRPIPEYSTLSDYLMKLLSSNNISTWDILDVLEKENKNDDCKVRREMKEVRYEVLRKKYREKVNSENSSRFLLSLLAVKGVDDDYFKEYESCGSLSVNNYNQLKIEELNKNHITFFAHPNEDKLHIMDNVNENICGMEYNKQSYYSDPNVFFEKAKELNKITVIGSDSHTVDSKWYEDINFYKANKNELKKFIEKSKKYLILGLDKDNVELKEYNEIWNDLYIEEEKKIKELIGDKILEIKHVGSTSIPGLSAKPIIDIAVAVNSLNEVNDFKNILINEGYLFRDDGGIKGEYLFYRGYKSFRTHYIHVVEMEGKRWHDYNAFKDCLLKNPNKVIEYQKLKESLSSKYKNERKKYTLKKADFINEILENWKI